jgi:uncharacterized protein (DUF1501 family)
MGLKRRDFVRVGGLFGISLQQFFAMKVAMAAAKDDADAKAKAQACILLWLEGGPSQVDTWDPKSNSRFKPISTNVAGIQISELLPKVSKHMHRLSIIRSMHTPENDHTEATYYAMTGHRPNPAMLFPSLGSVIAKEIGPRNGVPPYVLEPQWESQRMYEDHFKSAFLGPEYDPMIVPDPSHKDFVVPDLSLPKDLSFERLQNRRQLLKLVDAFHRRTESIAEYRTFDSFTEQALKMILSPAVKTAFDVSKESEKTKDAYGRNGFGQSVLLARRLIESGCRFVTAAGYKDAAWDTHQNNDKLHRESLTPQLDQSLAFLLEDLAQRGLLDSTVVVVMGEFGRTPQVNANGGRDHWPHCWSLAIGGGGIPGGQIVGASDAQGGYVADRRVTVGDLAATVYKAFGIDWTKEYMSPIGRPIKIANSINDETGEPIKELV